MNHRKDSKMKTQDYKKTPFEIIHQLNGQIITPDMNPSKVILGNFFPIPTSHHVK